jgi:cell division transport system permease protein
MNFWFTIREGFKGFKRARLSTVITISSIVFSHFLIGMFLLISINVDSWIGNLRSKLEIEIFLDRTLSEDNGQIIHSKVKKIKGIKFSQFLSKEDAAKRFEKEFGKNVYEILQSNPLPASITVTLQPEFQNARGAAEITKELSKIEGVEDVIYQKDLIQIIDNYLDIIYTSGIVIVVLLITITFILLYNTIRVTIYGRRDIIEIMKLVGAKKSFIKRPFLIEGLLQGFLGAAIASGAVFLAFKVIVKTIYPYLFIKPEIYIIIIVMGMLIGYMASMISVQKHLETV